MPETPPGGYLFRLQDVEKQRERRKTKAKKGRKKKEKKAWKHEKMCVFYYKIGENEIFGQKVPIRWGLPHIYIYIYISLSLSLSLCLSVSVRVCSFSSLSLSLRLSAIATSGFSASIAIGGHKVALEQNGQDPCLGVTSTLCQKFPRAKLRRQIFFGGRETGRKIGRNFGRNFEGVFVLCSLCRITQKNFSQKSPQFISPCPANV